MIFPLRSASTILLVFLSLLQLETACGDTLPFTIKVSRVESPTLPVYLDPHTHPSPNGWATDFPVSSVVIDGEIWIIYKNGYSPMVIRYKGSRIDNAVRQPDGTLNPTNPTYGTVVNPYLLGGMWYDQTEKKLYGPMHCEYQGYTSGAGIVTRQVHLASSTDKGLTWNYEGPLLTGDTSVPPFAHSGSYWEGGDGDFYLFVDEPGGYTYLFTTYYLWPKPGLNAPFFMRHRVARCKLSDKMASGKWQRFYNGAWDQPGIGGKASYVNAHRVIYNSYLKKFVSFNYGSSLSYCTDLSRQDWSPCFSIPGDFWGTQKNLEMTPVHEDGINTWACGQTMHLYTYLEGWNAGPGNLYQIEFGPGETSDVAGYLGWGAGVDTKKFFDPAWEGHPSTDPLRPYGEPSYDSGDTIESRHVRKIGCNHTETIYTGAWKPEETPIASRVSDQHGDSVELSYKGTGVFWRAEQAPDCGKADVFLDGSRQKTVDCCGGDTPYKFWFVKTGLDPKAVHTIKIVVRGDKNAKATGARIKHLGFECAAETNLASDAFSGVMGKNGWHYLAGNGANYSPLTFEPASNSWQDGKLVIGADYLVPGETRDAVRQWVADRDGVVRVEGVVSVSTANGNGIKATVLHNAEIVWPETVVQHAKPLSHDLRVKMAKGDTLSFRVICNGTVAPDDRTQWDPAITFVDPQ
jgi:hypothetical protein